MKPIKLLSLLPLLLLFGCDQPQPHIGKESPAGASAQKNEPAAPPVWPFINANEKNALSADLLSKNIYIVFDGSGSMADRGCSGNTAKIHVARAAFKEFLQKVPSGANVGLHVFDQRGSREVVPLGTNNRDDLVQAIDAVVPRAGTPLGPAITNAYKKITMQGKNQLGYGEYHIVVITDGIANAGHEPGYIVDQVLAESPVVLHTIGFCIGTQHDLNRPGYVLYKAAENKEMLAEGLQGVLAESPEYAVVKFQ